MALDLTRRVPGPASLLIVAALYGWVSGRWAIAGLLATVLAAPMAMKWRVAPGVRAERWIALATIVAGVLIALLVAPRATGGEALGLWWSVLALPALIFSAGRLFLREPSLGAHGTAAAGLVALAACGGIRSGPVYAAAVLAYLALALLAMRGDDHGRPALQKLPRRGVAGALAAGGIALAAGGGAAIGLPPLHRWTADRVSSALASAQMGFSDRLWLGSLEGMLESDEEVLRLRGPRTDYLRGAVYDRYEVGRWSQAGSNPAYPAELERPPREGEQAILVTTLGGSRDRYFLPLGAQHIATPDGGGAVVADRFGTLKTPEGEATSVSFELTGGKGLRVAEPTDADLNVPPELRAPLQGLVAEWTAGAETPAQKLEAITRRLQTGFRYSLEFKRVRKEPLLEFLLENRQGHCEYFASATALLARAAGIPARVVVGYRVAERNPIDGDYMVREKNAHAWVEAHLPGAGWQTVDATPESSLPQNAPHAMPLASAVLDAVSALWARAPALPLGKILGALGGALAVAAILRRLRRRARRAGARHEAAASEEPPPPSFHALIDALARRGVSRSRSEPVERFADRVEAAGLDEAAALLRRYAALRYGGVGEAREISLAMESCSARI